MPMIEYGEEETIGIIIRGVQQLSQWHHARACGTMHMCCIHRISEDQSQIVLTRQSDQGLTPAAAAAEVWAQKFKFQIQMLCPMSPSILDFIVSGHS